MISKKDEKREMMSPCHLIMEYILCFANIASPKGEFYLFCSNAFGESEAETLALASEELASNHERVPIPSNEHFNKVGVFL